MLGAAWEIEDLNAHSEIPSPAETGTTFAENAVLKALSASRLFDGLVLAEDSGLEVDALRGAPGVFSARYAGPSATDAENRAKLLQKLREQSGSVGYRARFRCAMTLARKGQVLHTCEGNVEGQIIDVERGRGGFGYDPLFVPDGYDATFSELAPTVKNALSHRGFALAAVRESLISAAFP